MSLFDGIANLFGGGNDYGAGNYGGRGDDYQHKSDVAVGNVGGQISQYGDIAAGGISMYGRYNPDLYGALNTREQYLQQNPLSQQSHDAYLANRIGPTTAAYNHARAAMAQSAYNRGLDTPESAGASSVYAGNDAYLQNAQLGRENAAENAYADWANQEQNARQTGLIDLLSGASNQGLSQWNSGLGNEAAGNEWTANQYGDAAQRSYGLQQQALQHQQQDTSSVFSLLSGVSGLYHDGAFGGRAKSASDNAGDGANLASGLPGGDGGGANWTNTPASGRLRYTNLGGYKNPKFGLPYPTFGK